MFVNCSEISINVIVKHVQHVEIIWSCSLPWDGLIFKFFSAWEDRKNCWVDRRTGWFAMKINIWTDTMPNVTI